MRAAELAATIRRRFPQVDSNLEADLQACEDATLNDSIEARAALKVIQLLHRHREQLAAAVRPAGTGYFNANTRATGIERPS